MPNVCSAITIYWTQFIHLGKSNQFSFVGETDAQQAEPSTHRFPQSVLSIQLQRRLTDHSIHLASEIYHTPGSRVWHKRAAYLWQKIAHSNGHRAHTAAARRARCAVHAYQLCLFFDVHRHRHHVIWPRARRLYFHTEYI